MPQSIIQISDKIRENIIKIFEIGYNKSVHYLKNLKLLF